MTSRLRLVRDPDSTRTWAVRLKHNHDVLFRLVAATEEDARAVVRRDCPGFDPADHVLEELREPTSNAPTDGAVGFP